jgi:competence protein ComEC
MAKSKIFLISCLFFVAGIAIASFAPEKIVQNKFVWFSSFIFLLIIAIIFWTNKKIAFYSLWGCFLFLGIWRFSISFVENYPDNVWYYNGENITLVGVVAKEPDLRLKNQKLEIIVESVETHGHASLPVSGKLLITADLYPIYNFGDKLEITCDLKMPSQIDDFAYDRYLARYDIYSVCYYPKIKKIGEGTARNRPMDWLYKEILNFKNKIREAIKGGLSDPEAGLALGIMIGDRQGLGDELNQKFSQTGLTHIMAVSGMNMTIISAAAMWLFLALGMPRRRSFYWTLALIVIFTILVGAPASAVRASIMSSLALLALYLGRLNRIVNAIVFTAALMLVSNPRLLRDDVGFQLSFLAVLGIIYFYPIFKKSFDRCQNRFLKLIIEVVALTLSAQVFTLPIIAYNFKQISLIAPFSNLLVLWTIPFAMFFVFIGIIFSFLFSGLTIVFFAPANLTLKYMISAVEYASLIPFAYLKIDYLWSGWLIIYYAVVIYYLWKRNN